MPFDDAGAQHVHRIDATDARIAPVFVDVVGDLTGLLAGRVVVAHNSAFDAAFLVAEYEHTEWPAVGMADAGTLGLRRARVGHIPWSAASSSVDSVTPARYAS